MITGAVPIRCGGCGNDAVKLFRKDFRLIYAECQQCKSVSDIRVTNPQILISWNEEQGPQTGCLVEWPEEPK